MEKLLETAVVSSRSSDFGKKRPTRVVRHGTKILRGRRVRNARALFGQPIRFPACSVVNGEFVSSADQVERHRLAHVSEANECDFQVDAPSGSLLRELGNKKLRLCFFRQLPTFTPSYPSSMG